MNATQTLETFLQVIIDHAQQKNAIFVQEFSMNPVEALQRIGGTFQQVGRTAVAQEMLGHMNNGGTPTDVVDMLVKELNRCSSDKATGLIGKDQLMQSTIDAMADILNTAIDCAQQYKHETSIGTIDHSGAYADECQNV